MTKTKTISFELLAEKLRGKIWRDRIYVDKGFNTKKMTTKTYVFQQPNGTYGVSCFIECPSQPYSWIKSQQEEIVSKTLERIDEIIDEYGTDKN